MSKSRLTSHTAAIDSFRNYEEFEDHEMLIAVTDGMTGLKAYIGIHSTKLGPALGGTRLQVYASEETAIRDVLNLSKAMSYKCALANLPYGGGKAVVVIDPDHPKTDEMLAAYARAVENLRGLFKTGTDVGVTDEDVVKMSRHTAHMLGVTEADRGGLSTSSSAALGVFKAMRATLEHLDKNADLKDKKVAIKGVGKLGAELARLVHEAGAQLWIADVDAERCAAVSRSLPGSKVVETTEIHKQKVDIYAPCALGAEFTDEVIAELRCRAIVGGANNQLASPESGDQIAARDICYVPDYIANSGGLIYVADELEPGGFKKSRVLERVAGIEATVRDLLERAKQENLTTNRIADVIACERMEEGIR